MSVVLLGVDKPKDQCKVCDFYEYNPCDNEGICCTRLVEVDPFSVDDNCPMRQLPKNHGRLIDADRLLAVLKSMASTSTNVPTEAVIGLIDNQPVIVKKESNE